MSRLKKMTMSLLLSVMMVVTFIPTSAFAVEPAAGEGPVQNAVEEEVVEEDIMDAAESGSNPVVEDDEINTQENGSNYVICYKNDKGQYVADYSGLWREYRRYYLCKVDDVTGLNVPAVKGTDYASVAWSVTEGTGSMYFEGKSVNNYTNIRFAKAGSATLKATVTPAEGEADVVLNETVNITFNKDKAFDREELLNAMADGNVQPITLGRTAQINADSDMNLEPYFQMFEFEPEVDASYKFEVTGENEMKIFLYNSQGELMKYTSGNSSATMLRLSMAEDSSYFFVVGPADLGKISSYSATVALDGAVARAYDAKACVYDRSNKLIMSKSLDFNDYRANVVLKPAQQANIGEVYIEYKKANGIFFKEDIYKDVAGGSSFNYGEKTFRVNAVDGEDFEDYTVNFVAENKNDVFLSIKAVGNRSGKSWVIDADEFNAKYGGASKTITFSVPFEDYYNGVMFYLDVEGSTTTTAPSEFLLRNTDSNAIKVKNGAGTTYTYTIKKVRQDSILDNMSFTFKNANGTKVETIKVKGSVASTSAANPTAVYMPEWYGAGCTVTADCESADSETLTLYTKDTKAGSKKYLETQLSGYVPTVEGKSLTLKTYNSQSSQSKAYYLRFASDPDDVAELYDLSLKYSDGGSVKGSISVDLADAAEPVGATVILPKGISIASGSDDYVELVAEAGRYSSVDKPKVSVATANTGNKEYASITVKATSKNGTATKDYRVVVVENRAKSIAKADIEDIQSYTYDGNPMMPKPVVRLNGTELQEDTDYQLVYRDNVNAGTATVKIVGNGADSSSETKYFGTATKTFKINPALITSATVSANDQTYTGNTIKPIPDVKINIGGMERTLVNNVDFTGLTYGNNKNVGVATVKIEGKGNYIGAASGSFIINPKKTSISKLTAGSSSIKATWGKVTAQTTGYELAWKTAGDADFTIERIEKNTTTSKTVSNLPTAEKYIAKVRTYKVTNGVTYYSDWSGDKSVVVMPETPKFKDVNGIVPEVTGFTANWNTPDDVSRISGYEIRYSTSSTMGNPRGDKNIAPAVTTYNDETLVNGKTYYIQLRSFATIGGEKFYSAWSSKKSVKTALQGTTFTEDNALIPDVTSVVVNFNAAYDEGKIDGYQVRTSTSSNLGNAKMKTVAKSGKASYSEEFTDLANGKTYYFQVRTYKKMGDETYYSAWGTKKSVKTAIQSTSFVADNPLVVDIPNMKVTWKPVAVESKIDGYQVRYSTSSSLKNAKTVSTSTGTYSVDIPDLVYGKTYYFQVRTHKTVGEKTYYSSWCTKKSKAYKLSTVSFKSSGALVAKVGGFTANWNAPADVDNVDGYEVRYSTSSTMGNAKTTLITDEETLTCDVSGLAKKTYYVQIRSYAEVDGEKLYSSWNTKKKIAVK